MVGKQRAQRKRWIDAGVALPPAYELQVRAARIGRAEPESLAETIAMHVVAMSQAGLCHMVCELPLRRSSVECMQFPGCMHDKLE